MLVLFTTAVTVSRECRFIHCGLMRSLFDDSHATFDNRQLTCCRSKWSEWTQLRELNLCFFAQSPKWGNAFVPICPGRYVVEMQIRAGTHWFLSRW